MEVYFAIGGGLITTVAILAIAFAIRSRSLIRFYESRYAGIIDVDRAIEASRREQETVLQEIELLRASYREKRIVFDDLVRQAAIFDEEIELAELGFYKPHYDFDTSEAYKHQIDEVRRQQKEMMSEKTAVLCSTEWTVEGSRAKGRTMSNRAIRLTARAFNNECDAAISATRWNNVQRMEERIRKAFDAINKLNESNHVVIDNAFFDLKLSELRLTHEYREKRQEEREHQAELRRQQREEAQLRKDADRAQKDEGKFEKLLEKARGEAEKAVGSRLSDLQERIAGLEADLVAAHEKKERALSMAEQTKAGHVYVVSNVGSFGDEVFKIGMTRRLDPYDRVRELGDASVPFIFDVHAVVYSDDAPALENALHKRFQDRRVNLVNFRKEFFRATLEEIESCVAEIAPETTFIRKVEARDYKESNAMRAQVEAKTDARDVRGQFPTSI